MEQNKRLAALLVAVLVNACGGDGGGGGSSPPPAPSVPDLFGVWAGSWQGTDPTLGSVSGTWEVAITQGSNSATGPATLLGDVDCMDGQMQTNSSAQTAVTGTFTRPGCLGIINWTLTALNTGVGAASGAWSNTASGSGTLSGNRIARLTGPRIRFVSPPDGKPGAIVTIVGENLSGPPSVVFGGTASGSLISSDPTRIVVAVPGGATTGAVQVSNSGGTALSPRFFSTDVRSPASVTGGSTAAGSAPSALAVSPDGRKLYIADRGNGTIRIVRASTLQDLIPQPFPTTSGGTPRSVVASPDGRRIYVAVAGAAGGVRVLHAAIPAEVGSFPFLIDDRDNPQGLAISPDGRQLLVSDGTTGGNARLLNIVGDTLTVAATYAMPASLSLAPLGVAFSPDGSFAYIAGADTAALGRDVLRVVTLATGNVSDLAAGAMPTGIAVSPDGTLIFVTNQGGNTVGIYNSGGLVGNSPVTFSSPTGIAFGPDGVQLYVANKGNDTVSVLDRNGSAIGAPISVGQGPVAIAINPQGTTGYVSLLTAGTVVEIGGMRTLNVSLGGTGIGRVVSNPVGIDCGTACQAQFASGTSVTLTPIAAGGSFFSHWSGDLDCSDGTVILNQSAGTFRSCIAVFNSNTPPPSQQSPGGCFIATAAYGSEFAAEVQLLREFRDRTLMPSAAGRQFVRLYYRYSPPIAELIRPHEGARAAVRVALVPVVWSITNPHGAITIVLVLGVLGWGLRRRLRSARAGSSR